MTSKLNLGFIIAIFCTSFHLQSFGQAPSIKFGKIDESELNLKTCAIDSSAGAMIIGDYGSSYFTYDHAKERFQINYERHVRIKIFNKNGYSAAEDQIPYYHENNNKEEIIGLKGYTYNLENGKIIKTKLEKEGIFDEAINDNWTLKKFTLPNVKEGSVIEYSYTIKSNFLYNLRAWEFQKDIPVMWSEYTVKIPEYFDYKQVSQGYESFVLDEKKQSTDQIIFNYKTREGNLSTKTEFHNEKVTFQTYSHKWATKDVPAIREEPYMTTIDDYVTKINFELASVQFPRSPRKDYSRNWESITKELLEHEKFGGQLEKTSFIKTEVSKIVAAAATPEEKLSAIYEYVKSTMKWNEKNRMFTEKNLKKAYDDRVGNSAEINLLLVVMLREAGLNAHPVILSTRNNGRANMIWPTLHKFNYVVALVNLNNKQYFLDGTDPLLPIHMLPYKCLNGEGRVISKTQVGTVEIGNKEKRLSMLAAKYELNANGNLKGKIEESKAGLEAFEIRKSIVGKGKDTYIEEFSNNYQDWAISNLNFVNLESINSSYKSEFEFETSEFVQASSDIFYINPLLSFGLKANPFKLETRKFPVDIACPSDNIIAVNLTIPEGYTLEEKPENMILLLPDNLGKFSYTITQNGRLLMVSSTVSLTKGIFVGESYEYLREFFAQVVAKHSQQIVLKKQG